MPAKPFYNSIDLNKLELRNARVHVLASAPASPLAGQVYYNSTDGNLYVWDGVGSAWVDLTIQGSTVADATTSAKGIVQLAGDLGGTGTTAAAPVITAGAIDAGKVAGSLKPSVSAAAGTEALRAIGTTANTAMAGNTTLNSISAPTASVSLNSQKITNLLDPTAAQDAATKAYVDATASGLDVKNSVRVATVGDLDATIGPIGGYTYNNAAGTLTANSNAAPNAMDGIALAQGDRVLIKDRATPAQNGVYVLTQIGTAGLPNIFTRATDADSAAEITPGLFTFVEQGATNADSGWVLTTDAPITLGTTALNFVQFSGAGQITAGNGLQKAGNTLSVKLPASPGLTADGTGLYIGTGQVTNAMLAGSIDLTTKVTGNLPVGNGGTGSNTAAGARTNLSAAGIFKGTVTHDGATTSFTVTHNLNTQQVQVAVQAQSAGNPSNVVDVYWTPTSVNAISVQWDVAQANTTVFYVTVVG